MRGFLKNLSLRFLDPLYYFFALLSALSPKLSKGVASALAYTLGLATRASYSKPRTVSLRVNGTRFRLFLPERHKHAQQEYTRLASDDAVYEPVNIALLTRLLGHLGNPSFMDIGAFMGYFACYVSSFLGGRVDVYAVESNPQFCEAVRRSARLNGFPKLRVHNVALSEGHELVAIRDVTVLSAPGNRFGMRRNIVHAMPLDELCEREALHPNIVKMDVHGAEGKVLRGMRQVLRTSVQFLLLEMHPVNLLKRYSAGISREEMLSLLEDCGFTSFHVAGLRYPSSDGLRPLETGSFSYRPITPETRSLLLFDRRLDILILASKFHDIESIIGSSIEDPSLSW